MSYIREIEVRLAGIDAPSARRARDRDSERAFWGFVDLELDVERRLMPVENATVLLPAMSEIRQMFFGARTFDPFTSPWRGHGVRPFD